MTNPRLDDLIARLLDDAITSDELHELLVLIRDGDCAAELQAQLEAAELLALGEDDLRDEDLFVAAVRSRYEDKFVSRLRDAISLDESSAGETRNRQRHHRDVVVWIVSISLIAFLVLNAFFLRGAPTSVAEIIESNGFLQWTGDGGRVINDLRIGSSLGGGTLESFAADSFATLRFHDNTHVTVSGQSMLTLSGNRQKELHLRQGSLSAQVRPQPAGRPLVIHTPTARIEVIGTQLNVDATDSLTRLSVNEGEVRVTRLVDNQVAQVPAGHQIVASVNRSERWDPQKQRLPVHEWDSKLVSHVETYGEWLPPAGSLPRRLKAIPKLLRGKNKPITFYVAAFKVTASDSPPVILRKGARIRVRGRTKLAHNVEFGISTRKPNGGFAGKFEIVLPADKLLLRDEFEIEFAVQDFRPICKIPSPFGLQVEHLYIFTRGVDAKLDVSHVQLLSSGE